MVGTTLPTGKRGQLLAGTIAVLLLIVFWSIVVAPAVDFYTARAASLRQQQVIAARMAVLAAKLPDLQARTANGNAAPALPFTLDGASDAVAAAGLQNLVQQMATATGANLSSVEILQAQPSGNYRRIGLKLSLTAPWPVLVALLQQINQATPPLLVDDLEIHAAPITNGASDHPLDAALAVYAFRAVTQGGDAP